MARIRTIKPEFPQSESMGRVSREARLCFILLWTIMDDSGRVRGNSRMLASLLYPYDDDAPKLIEGWLTELEHEDCIRRYQIANDHYLECCNWLKHQKIDKPSTSRLPPFTEASRIFSKPREHSSGDLVPSTLDLVPGPSLLSGKEPDARKPKLGKATRGGKLDGFADWYAAYPRKEARGAATKAYAAARRKVGADVLLAGALVYADRRSGEDRKFTKLPATWLNAECWADEAQATPISDTEKTRSERYLWLEAYGFDGRWVKNKSANGVWVDAFGVGPPPHDLRTLVTLDDLEKFPGALAMRAHLMATQKGTVA
jgi:hypothetical protein